MDKETNNLSPSRPADGWGRYINTPAPPVLTREYFDLALKHQMDPNFLMVDRPVSAIYHDLQYNAFLKDVRDNGRHKEDRTGTGTTAKFGHMMRFDIRNGIIPLLTGKKMHLPSIIHEIIWYLSGSPNIKYLQDNGVRIWNEWADANGDLGPVYGVQWRNWKTYDILRSDAEDFTGDTIRHTNATVIEGKVDQIQQALDDLKNNPDSRRIIVNAWNVAYIKDMKLPPCHFTFQFYAEEMTWEERVEWWQHANNKHGIIPKVMDTQLDKMGVPRRYLSCLMSQRSADAFLGVPFNIAQYSILTHLVAKLVGMAPKEFIWSGGDCHIYDNLKDQVDEQLTRIPYPSPRLLIADNVDNFENLSYNDFLIEDYQCHPAIKGKVAV